MSAAQGVPVLPDRRNSSIERYAMAWCAGYAIGWLIADELDSRRRARARARRLLAALVEVDDAQRAEVADSLDAAAAEWTREHADCGLTADELAAASPDYCGDCPSCVARRESHRGVGD